MGNGLQACSLSKQEAREIMAYFQGFWRDDIYASWQEIDHR
jgi:hypothetical protein